MKPQIAIIEPNTLACMGLHRLLETIIPVASVRCFGSFSQLVADTPDMYAHYFVAAQVYFEHTAFFLERRPKSIVLAAGEGLPQLAGIATLNTQLDEPHLVKSILQLHQHGHPHHLHAKPADETHDLSPREIEVLQLLVRGLINKEIADRLHISLTTVISHRKNIVEKLGIKSLSGLAVYAVMRGYVEADSL